MEEWDPRADSVAEAVDRLQHNFDDLTDGVKEQVYCHAVECGSREELRALQNWLMVPGLVPDDQVGNWDRDDEILSETVLYRCAVLKGRLDVLKYLLQNEHSADSVADLFVNIRMQWREVFSDDFVAVIKDAPAYDFRTVASWVLRWEDALEVLQCWFPEVFDFSALEKVDKALYFFIVLVMKRDRLDILQIIEERVPSMCFFHNDLGKNLLLCAAAKRTKECIETVLRWVPSVFKTARGDVSGLTPCEIYVTPKIHYNYRTRERTQEEGWIPDPEVVAMLTVHTKGAHSS